MPKPFVDVAVGIILRHDGRLLLGQRPEGKPWSAWWELPGGMIEPGETVHDALVRELKEELDIEVTEATPWVTYVHEYPKTIVRLAFWKVTGWNGEARGMENQALAWVDPQGPLEVGPVLPATEPPLRWLTLPDRYFISSIGSGLNLDAWLQRLDAALADGVRLVQFREPEWECRARGNEAERSQLTQAFKHVLARCRAAGARLLVNGAHQESWWTRADGVHLRAADVQVRRAVPRKPALVAASVHNEDELKAAAQMQVEFMVIGHVLDTPSHPDAPGMGWQRFAELAQAAGCPVYAIGGQNKDTLATARQHGAHGIAFIRAQG